MAQQMHDAEGRWELVVEHVKDELGLRDNRHQVAMDRQPVQTVLEGKHLPLAQCALNDDDSSRAHRAQHPEGME
jgi:hypothetical protein